ncbi:stigma-specific STIG1-like protein 1 [Dioscorea cayenensis subsp. rotundata]|uniref:Stigma-specific STIG1-like protein 1 n=1 Tax=Dioscorea cayennensis subsp. rotundata TaxID=55577 RepID=A0AB40B8V7_DIOCR|nr:stigma-specific STIG1-like protein 1 [Dioscorea cayenensis subsp. rotundata]
MMTLFMALGSAQRFPMTCDKFPRVCRARGSPGPDCCRRTCVNVMIDSFNCGKCGRRCKYGEACCGGNCVNVFYDPKNCGGCKRKCVKGAYCSYGMCSYGS